MNRKPISKRIRFEVFKRDGFKCQYCGQAAPDVVLECDHVVAVANGGDNGILNLVTSCSACNSGKSANSLSESAVAIKQRAQAQHLQDRREQIKMMAEWSLSLADITQDEVEAISTLIKRLTTHRPTETGLAIIRRWLKKFSLSDLMQATHKACDCYVRLDAEGKVEHESVRVAFEKIPAVARMSQIDREDPLLREFYYVRGILRNRFPHSEKQINRYCINLCRDAHDSRGWGPHMLRRVAADARNWREFEETIQDTP